MSEEENERDFMKACFNVVAGLEVKNENQVIAKEVILDEVEYLTKENIQLKEVIEEVRKEIYEYKKIMEDGIEKGAYYLYLGSLQQRLEKLLQILDKVKGEDNE